MYDTPASGDGVRILVERLWPRGVSTAAARLDLWAKDAAPSTGLRKWFNHDPARWTEFKRRYYRELDAKPDALRDIRDHMRHGPVTFLFGSRETRLNNAVALKAYVESLPGS